MKIFNHQKNKTKIGNQDTKFCSEFDADSKTFLIFLLALIVFDLLPFEGSKCKNQGYNENHICNISNFLKIHHQAERKKSLIKQI